MSRSCYNEVLIQYIWSGVYEVLIQYIWSGISDSSFLTVPSILILLLQRLHLKSQDLGFFKVEMLRFYGRGYRRYAFGTIHSFNTYLFTAYHASRLVPDIGIAEGSVAQSHLSNHILVKETDVQTNIFQNQFDPDSWTAISFISLKSLSSLWLSLFYSSILRPSWKI